MSKFSGYFILQFNVYFRFCHLLSQKDQKLFDTTFNLYNKTYCNQKIEVATFPVFMIIMELRPFLAKILLNIIRTKYISFRSNFLRSNFFCSNMILATSTNENNSPSPPPSDLTYFSLIYLIPMKFHKLQLIAKLCFHKEINCDSIFKCCNERTYVRKKNLTKTQMENISFTITNEYLIMNSFVP